MTETVELKPCPFCSDPMRIKHSIFGHVDQGKCIIGALAWDITFIPRWNTRSDPAVRDRVKALKWGSTSYGSPEAVSIAGVYRITDAWDGGFNVNRGQTSFQDTDGRKNFPTIDAAEAAAQADYEQRILSALEPRTSPPEPALGWMPIESAPHGRLVLLGFDSHPTTVGRYEFGTWVYAFCVTEGGESPTHWQPLPVTPAKEPQ